MAKTFKVEMNINEPDETLKNANKAFDKHTALGAGSPLTGFIDMAAFGIKVDNAILMRKNADEQRIIFEEKYSDASMRAGTGKGQTKNSINTIYYGAVQVRDILLVKHRGSEETLEHYGFNVVISTSGARRIVRVDIPYDSTPKMIELGRKIVDRHTVLGVGSPLTGNIDMTAFETLVTDAEGFLAEWETAKDLAQELNNDAIMLIGYGAGQTKDTVGTIYYNRCSIRDRLLQKYQDNEEHLQAFGFEVVISEHKAGGGGSGTPVPTFPLVLQGGLDSGNLWSYDLSNLGSVAHGPLIFTIQNDGSVHLRIYGASSPTELPGAGAMLDVFAGSTVVKNEEQMQSQVGISNVKPHLNVYNIGGTAGHFIITISEV